VGKVIGQRDVATAAPIMPNRPSSGQLPVGG